MSKSRGLQINQYSCYYYSPDNGSSWQSVSSLFQQTGWLINWFLQEGTLENLQRDLSGKSEVPAVDTKATGTAQFQIGADGNNWLIMNLM